MIQIKRYFTHLVIIFSLVLINNFSMMGDENKKDIEVDKLDSLNMREIVPDNPDFYSPGQHAPLEAEPVNYSLLAINPSTNEKKHDESDPDSRKKEEELTDKLFIYDRQIIETEEEFRRVFGKSSDSIDWKTKRILVYQETMCYKLNDLEYTSFLSGVSQYGSTIYVETNTTQHGPCQGICQDMSWFTFKTHNLYLLLPKLPEKITYFYNNSGGCPPDIP